MRRKNYVASVAIAGNNLAAKTEAYLNLIRKGIQCGAVQITAAEGWADFVAKSLADMEQAQGVFRYVAAANDPKARI